MTTDGTRISQLSSAISVFGAMTGSVGADGQTNSASDGAHWSRLARDEMARLSGFYPVTSTGGLVGSTTTANLVTESTGPNVLASTRYAQSRTP